jgi:spermidine synthase
VLVLCGGDGGAVEEILKHPTVERVTLCEPDADLVRIVKFYNGETHEGVFALPNFIRDLVNPPRLKMQGHGRRLGVVHAAVK